jgi:hypothetical protein
MTRYYLEDYLLLPRSSTSIQIAKSYDTIRFPQSLVRTVKTTFSPERKAISRAGRGLWSSQLHLVAAEPLAFPRSEKATP